MLRERGETVEIMQNEKMVSWCARSLKIMTTKLKSVWLTRLGNNNMLLFENGTQCGKIMKKKQPHPIACRLSVKIANTKKRKTGDFQAAF